MRQILCLSADPWRTIPTRTQQLMTRMRDAQVLLFEPPGKYSRQPGRRVRPGLTVCALPPVLEAEERHRLLFRLHYRKHRLTMVNTPLNRALGVRNQIFHSNDTRSAVAWTWERMMSATCRRSSKSMLSQFPRWEDRYSIFCGETLSAFSAAISLISP